MAAAVADDPCELALDVAAGVRDAVRAAARHRRRPARVGRAPGGDATLHIDEVAEAIVEEVLGAAGDIGFYSEDRGLVTYGQPRAFFVIDPVDGTRPAAAGLESCCVSVAVVPPLGGRPARRRRLRRGARAQDRRPLPRAARGRRGGRDRGDGTPIPVTPSANTDLRALFWTAGLRGRPSSCRSASCSSTLVDGSSMGGGYFDLGSAAFNLTRLANGQLDAYVDVGRRVVDEVPRTEAAFLAVGEGAVCTNFPYDVAAAALIVQEAGGVVTHADGRPLADHPAVGSSRAPRAGRHRRRERRAARQAASPRWTPVSPALPIHSAA